ncbi:hypothetical protein [Massilia sp. Leaf139]|uniref:hypothetical protein n=1 Tax=Massilia sp. Leaf139 TaxID=1736272 RepID=UPI0006F899A4|nr:hypothetical protein [Massilia sp. Leaf139]KQQ97190.1 hypothetical protein ASF77_04315 [Massilia sp. Leaf139]
MNKLTITDLASTQELDQRSMACVRGGWSMAAPYWKAGDLTYAPVHDSSITATQSLLQGQSVTTATANGSAFLGGVHVDSDVDQRGDNKIIG